MHRRDLCLLIRIPHILPSPPRTQNQVNVGAGGGGGGQSEVSSCVGEEEGVVPAGFVRGVFAIHRVVGVFRRDWLLSQGFGLRIVGAGRVADGGPGRQGVVEVWKRSGGEAWYTARVGDVTL